MSGADLGSIGEDGYLSFHSRKDDVITSRGTRSEPVEVEDPLAAHGAIMNAVVIVVPHETRGELIRAYVALSRSTSRPMT